MAASDDLEQRVSALETEVHHLIDRVQRSERDAAAARVLAGGADRDVGEIRAEIRDFRDQNNRVLNAMRGDLTTMRGELTTMRGDLTTTRGELTTMRGDLTGTRTDVDSMRSDLVGLAERTDAGFAQVRGALDATAAGQTQIVALLDQLIRRES